MTKPRTIIFDMVILGLVSTVFVAVMNAAFSNLKKAGSQSDPVITAILQSDTNTVAQLMKDPKINPDKPDVFGRTPLLWAAYVNYNLDPPPPPGFFERLGKRITDALRALTGSKQALAEEKPPKALNLVEMADKKRALIVRILLDRKVNAETKDNDGWTALMWASWSGMPEVAKVLIEKGIPLAVADRKGNTALTLAAQRGNTEIVKLLLANGADKTARTPSGKTPLDFAKTGRDQYTARRANYDQVIALLQ